MISPRSKVSSVLIFISLLLIISTSLCAQTIPVAGLTSAPVLDGSDADWQGIHPAIIPLEKSGNNVTVNIASASIRAGTFKNEIFLFIQWEDATKDDQHKPFIWDTAKNKYIAGEQREDRLALQFEMTGDYSVNWLSGNSFKADMWHWKAARTNPNDLIHDKMTIIGTEPVKKAYKATAENGAAIYIQRPGDKGDKLYSTKRYATRDKDIMPKYILTRNPQGSIADIRCKGVWKDGKWNLEIRRKLNTGHADDLLFSAGKTVKAGLAIFDHSGDDNHVISKTFTFQF